MKYSFHPEAEAEFVQAIEYYEECEADLGYDFAVEVYSAIERTMAYPKAWPIIEEDLRRSLVRRFPYGILYAVEDPTCVRVIWGAKLGGLSVQAAAQEPRNGYSRG